MVFGVFLQVFAVMTQCSGELNPTQICNNTADNTYRHTFTVDAIHHSEGGPQVRVPRLLQLVRLAAKTTF